MRLKSGCRLELSSLLQCFILHYPPITFSEQLPARTPTKPQSLLVVSIPFSAYLTTHVEWNWRQSTTVNDVEVKRPLTSDYCRKVISDIWGRDFRLQGVGGLENGKGSLIVQISFIVTSKPPKLQRRSRQGFVVGHRYTFPRSTTTIRGLWTMGILESNWNFFHFLHGQMVPASAQPTGCSYRKSSKIRPTQVQFMTLIWDCEQS